MPLSFARLRSRSAKLEFIQLCSRLNTPFITFPRRLSQIFGCLGNYAYLRSVKSLNRKNMQDFMTPSKHVNFRAKKLFGEMGHIVDGSIAYIDLNGGGPTELHTHEHNHLFIVTEGEARIQLGDETVIIHKDEAFLVEGRIPHSCWNNTDGVTKMIGITVI